MKVFELVVEYYVLDSIIFFRIKMFLEIYPVLKINSGELRNFRVMSKFPILEVFNKMQDKVTGPFVFFFLYRKWSFLRFFEDHFGT